MFYIYLASLIFGGSLLAFSLIFGGGDGDSHVDHHLGDGDSDFDFSTDHDTHHLISGVKAETSIIESSLSESSQIQHHIVHDAGSAVSFLSFRNFTFFTAFFGLTGTIFDFLSMPFLLGLIGSLAIGSFAWVFGYKLMKYFAANETGMAINLDNLKGKNAVVTLRIAKDRTGKIFVSTGAEQIELPARLSSISQKEEFKPREEVMIIDIKSNVAYIDEYSL